MKVSKRIISNIKNLQKPLSKSPLYIKLDSDVLSWYRSQGKGYQIFINDISKSYKETAEKNDEASPSRIALAQSLFNEFHAQCFWHLKKELIVTESEIPLIIDGLKRFGGREGFIQASNLCR